MIERLNPTSSAAKAQVCLFDFDGTISLIRSGWTDVMIPLMVGILIDTKTGETEDELRQIVESYVGRLTGKQTIYQMIELAEQVRLRSGTALDPFEYKRMYLARLHEMIRDRILDLQNGGSPEKYLVPGVRSWIESLSARGLRLCLASGTDQTELRDEARLLDVDRYFDIGVYGALDDFKRFSKKILIQGLIARNDCHGEEFLCFGDGYVEIENVKEVGGVAVGVATSEPECREVDQWKRTRLVGVGADFIVPNYLCQEQLSSCLFNGKQIFAI